MSGKGTILLVEDDESLREVMAFQLEEAGYRVLAVDRAEKALQHYDESLDLVVTDLRMPGMGGMELLERLRKRDADVVVLVVTAYGGTDRAVEAMRKGAYHYVEKPVNITTLLVVIEKAVEHRRLRKEKGALAHALREEKRSRHTIVAASPGMNRVLRMVDKVADSDATILITGESGTGKELVARAIHARSSRAKRPFVTVNCAAIPGDLLESMLFGHEKGAFTGASKASQGKFRQADRGTIFLDEVAEMPLALQSKLLRVLQEGEVEVVGGQRPHLVDVRVIAATHQDLDARIRQGSMRQDLYYRLNVVPVHVPSLRERPEDIPVLSRTFLRKANPGHNVSLSREVETALVQYDWPGNVRELQNVIERMSLLRESEQITRDDLPPLLRSTAEAQEEQEGLPFALPEDGFDLVDLERRIILAVMDKMKGNQSAAARYLRIPRHVLLYRLEKFGLR